MDAIFSQDFGTLGMGLVIFIVAFTAVLMPVGIYVIMKKIVKESEAKAQAQGQQKHA